MDGILHVYTQDFYTLCLDGSLPTVSILVSGPNVRMAFSASPITYDLGGSPHIHSMIPALYHGINFRCQIPGLKFALVFPEYMLAHGEVSSMSTNTFYDHSLPIKIEAVFV